jgi:MFS family permease
MTTLCGVASGFVSLFAARLGVGVGEAGGTPPSHSLISDYFPAERRGFAMGILYLYIPIGFLIGFLSGGWLDQLFGWRVAFVVVGVPGVAVAILLRLTLREPPRGLADKVVLGADRPSFWSSIRYFLRCPSLRQIPLGGAIQGIGAFATSVWLPAYFIRVHGLSSGEAGTLMAIAYGAGGGIGVLLGGHLADSLARRSGDERWYAWEPALVIALTSPLMLVVLSTSTVSIAFAALLAATTLGHMHLGPITAMMQNVSGVRRRAMVAGFYLFFVNLIAVGIGPVLAGLISDALTAKFAVDSLRYALLAIVPTTSLWAAVHFLLVARTLLADKRKAGEHE